MTELAARKEKHVKVPKTQRVDHVPNRVPPQPGECRDAVHWFVDSLGLYQGSVRGLFLSDYSEDQEALLESAVINFKSRGVTTLVISGEMLYKQADYLFQHAVAQSPFGRPLLSKMELDMMDADVLIVKDLNAPETPQQLWYLFHHLLYPRALSQRSLLISTQLGYDEFLGYGAMCEDLEYAGRKVTWEKVAWLLDSMMIDLHHFRQLRGENLPPMLKVEYYLYKAVASRGLNMLPQHVLGDYSLDFALVERRGNKLAIECDILTSLDQPHAGSADAKKTLVLLSDGWSLLRFTTAELLANLGGCVEAVEETWVHGYKKSGAGRLVSGKSTATVLDLPVEEDIQRLAILNGGGPVAITGGAGTGKSTCITRRVCHLLTQGVAPERILVVSHSTESVRALRTQVEQLYDRQLVQKVSFHSWNELGLRLLKENTGAIKRKPPLKVEANPQRVIQRLLTKYKKDLDQLTLELSQELEEFTIASLISLYKANLVTPKHVKERAKGNVDELVARVYQGYEEQLQKSNKIDRDDMVCLAAQLLADNADIRARYQYQFEYVLVDEYQDATAAADLLARILAMPQDNLYIAGDEDESIFESKGALPRILSEISVRLPNCRCYVMERNWRCHPEIVYYACKLLEGLHRRRILKDMIPGWEMPDTQAVIGPYQAAGEAEEAEWVASEIQTLLASGRDPQDIAILYRYNRYASMVEEALFRKGIKCLTTNPDSTLVPDEVADVMAFLRLVMDPDGPKARESFERVCQLRSKEVDPKLFGTIASFAEANNLSFLKAVEIYSEAVADQSCQDLEQLVRIIRTMNHENLPPAETIALLKRTQRLNEYYKSVKVPPGVNYEPMRKLTALEEEARKFKTVADFVRSQQNMQKPVDGKGESEPLVYILSLHEAKGKEFPVVFLTGMAEGLFPSETANDPEEERRLCYLGLTRAKELLYLSYPSVFNTVPLEPSRYLLETELIVLDQPAPEQAAPPVAQASQVQQAPLQPHQIQQAQLQQLQQQPHMSTQDKEAALRAQQDAARAQAQQAAQQAAVKAQQEAALKAQQEAALKAQQEVALKAQQEAQLRAQHEAHMRALQEQKARAEEQAALKARQEAALRAQQEAALKAQQEAALKAQQEAALRAQQEAALRAQQEAALRAQQEAALRAQQEAALRAQQEAALRAQQEAALRAQQEAALRAQQEAALRAQQEEARSQQSAINAQQAAAMNLQQEAALSPQQEIFLRAQQEAALRAQQEASMRSPQENALKAQQEARMRAAQEAQLRAQQQAEMQSRQEMELRAQHEAQVRARLEATQRQQPVQHEAELLKAESEAREAALLQQEAASRRQVVLEAADFVRQAQEEEARAAAEAQAKAAASAAALGQSVTAADAAPGHEPAEDVPVAVPERLAEKAAEVVPEVPVAPAKGKGKGKKKAQQEAAAQEVAAQQAAAQVGGPPVVEPVVVVDEAVVGLPPLAAQAEFEYQAPAIPIPKPSVPVMPINQIPASNQIGQFNPFGAANAQGPDQQPQAPAAQPGRSDTGSFGVPVADPWTQPVTFEPSGNAPPPNFFAAEAAPVAPVVPAEPVAPAEVQPVLPDPVAAPAAVAAPKASEPDLSAEDVRETFWNTVNSAMKGEPRVVSGGGVPQGVSAPIPAEPLPETPYVSPLPSQAYASAVPAPAAAYGLQPAARPTPGSFACPGCAEPLEPGSRFCGECGFRLETRINTCHLCGAPQEPGAKFCGECGSKSIDSTTPAVSAQDLEMQQNQQEYETYLSGQKPSQQGWVTKLKKFLD